LVEKEYLVIKPLARCNSTKELGCISIWVCIGNADSEWLIVFEVGMELILKLISAGTIALRIVGMRYLRTTALVHEALDHSVEYQVVIVCDEIFAGLGALLQEIDMNFAHRGLHDCLRARVELVKLNLHLNFLGIEQMPFETRSDGHLCEYPKILMSKRSGFFGVNI
jgi:hypothetical protein